MRLTKIHVPDTAPGTLKHDAFSAFLNKDMPKALCLFKKMATLDSAVACYYIGDIYMIGQGGISFDPNEARKWYERAYASSIPTLSRYAAIRLGYIYEAGYDESNRCGAAIDNEKAFRYYRKLEDSDIAVGLLRLGIMYGEGKGTEKDLTKAMSLYRRAAGRHVIALKNFGILKIKTGNPLLGYMLWAAAIAEGIFLCIFKRNSPRISVI